MIALLLLTAFLSAVIGGVIAAYIAIGYISNLLGSHDRKEQTDTDRTAA